MNEKRNNPKYPSSAKTDAKIPVLAFIPPPPLAPSIMKPKGIL